MLLAQLTCHKNITGLTGVNYHFTFGLALLQVTKMPTGNKLPIPQKKLD